MKASEIVKDLLRIALILVSFLFMLSIISTNHSDDTLDHQIYEEPAVQESIIKPVRKKMTATAKELPIPEPLYPEWKIPDNPYILEIEEVAKAYDFVEDLDCLIYAMMKCESNFNPSCQSSAGCIGLMQVSQYWHKDRAAKLGVEDLWDPFGNILTATDFLEDLYYNYAHRDIVLSVMMYNMDFEKAKYMYYTGKWSQYAVDVFRIFDELKGG